ncbi:hypothetical protein B0H19DRAFT_1352068 [Mycena capillaripes]|nr:hypothetical protein B0H19DRAFT_1352068 [Mycena capillaripes]
MALRLPSLLIVPFSLQKVVHWVGGALGTSRGLRVVVVEERNVLFASFRNSVVPAASPDQLLAKESLREGWTGQWRDITQEKKMRNGMWGDYSHARVILSIPDLPAYPIGTPIPIRLQISTETKLVRRSDRPDRHGKPLFPAPPTESSRLKQVLRRVTEIVVRGKTSHQTDTFDLPMTQGLGNVEMQRVKSLCEVQAVVDEPEWISKEKDRGIWKRSVQFTPTFLFPFSPSLSTQTIDWQVISFHLWTDAVDPLSPVADIIRRKKEWREARRSRMKDEREDEEVSGENGGVECEQEERPRAKRSYLKDIPASP